jgi:cell division protein FtsX
MAILVLSFIAGLELVAVTVTIRAAVAWSPRLAGGATVAVGGGGLESAEAATARATEILARAPGVARIWVLDPDPGDALAARLMGLAEPTAGGDPPRLLATTFIGAESGSAAALARDLRRENVSAAVDDHGVWTGPLERAAVAAAAVAAAVLLILLALGWAFAAGSARGTFRGHAARARLLLYLGATDAMVTAPFRAGAVGAAALGALIGVVAAAVVGAATIWSPALADWLHSRIAQLGTPPAIGPGLDVWDLAVVAIWPPLAVLVATGAAGRTARAKLRALA